MQVQSILNRVEKQKGFVYESVRWANSDKRALVVTIKPHSRSRPICSGCGRKRLGYDKLQQRKFSFIPLWALSVTLVYAMRRVNCPQCGIVVERVPWTDGKHQSTYSYRLFLASWAKRISWKETATIFATSWDTVFRSVDWVVRWGLAHRPLQDIESIGVDEIQYRRGHRYLTLVYQIDAGCKRLLYVSKDRTEESFRGFFEILPQETVLGLRFVCSDMWHNYLKVAQEMAGHTIQILDRFHISKKFGEKIDKVRATESKQIKVSIAVWD